LNHPASLQPDSLALANSKWIQRFDLKYFRAKAWFGAPPLENHLERWLAPKKNLR